MAEHTEHGAIYLLRHGQTEWSRTGRHTGRTDVALTDVGEQQARRAGTVLSALRATDVPPAAVLCSPRQRARRTAALVGLVVKETTELLSEWDYGDYEGLTTKEIREKVPQWTVWSHPIPGGESSDAVHERALRVLDLARNALPAGDVVLIGHGHFTRVLIAAWLGEHATTGERYGLGPASVSVVGTERGTPQIRHLNIPPAEVARLD